MDKEELSHGKREGYTYLILCTISGVARPRLAGDGAHGTGARAERQTRMIGGGHMVYFVKSVFRV